MIKYDKKIIMKNIIILIIPLALLFCSKKSKTPNEQLLWAVQQGNLAKINFALANGANVNATDESGNTALMFACKKRSPRLAKFLVYSTKINVNAKNKKGNTALIIAAENGNSAIIRFLLSKKSRARAKTKDELVNVNDRNKQGKTALSIALENNYRVIARLLIIAGAKR